jgi:hypothetical protein
MADGGAAYSQILRVLDSRMRGDVIRSVTLLFVVGLATACGSTQASHRLYTPAEVKSAFVKRGVPVRGFAWPTHTATAKKFEIRTYFLGQSEKTALRVLVFDRIYRKPPSLDKFLCAHAGPCQRWALVRNVEVFYFPTTRDSPRIRAAVTALRKGS